VSFTLSRISKYIADGADESFKFEIRDKENANGEGFDLVHAERGTELAVDKLMAGWQLVHQGPRYKLVPPSWLIFGSRLIVEDMAGKPVMDIRCEGGGSKYVFKSKGEVLAPVSQWYQQPASESWHFTRSTMGKTYELAVAAEEWKLLIAAASLAILRFHDWGEAGD